jgi:hypothetical protein
MEIGLHSRKHQPFKKVSSESASIYAVEAF